MSMSDRELLGLAAKAAGIVSLRWGLDDPDRQISGEGQFIGATWNPLTDDGDALRLAVKLAIGVQSLDGLGYSIATAQLLQKSIRVREDHRRSSPGEATRLAIVRAAAEIGLSQNG